MMSKKTKIWISRPENQAEALKNVLEGAGFAVFTKPLFAIEPLAVAIPNLPNNTCFDYFIVTSAQSIYTAPKPLLAWLQQQVLLGSQFIAIGRNTLSALHAYGISAIRPNQPNSEGLLSDFADKIPPHAKVGIIKGKGGRNALNDYFREKNPLTLLETYERKTLFHFDLSDFSDIDIAVYTSTENLLHLIDIFPTLHARLSLITTIVVSLRSATLLKEKGFKTVIIAPSPYNEGILESIQGITR